MRKQEYLSLSEIVSKIKEIANRDYDGEIYDNILAIFNTLQLKEKKILLRAAIRSHSLKDIEVSVEDTRQHEKKQCPIDDISVEEYNSLELIKLKTWLVKATTISFLFIVICFTIISMKVQTNSDTTFVALKGFLDIIKIIFST